METEKFSIQKRIKSFSYAFAGIKAVIAKEHNTWIHLIATILVLIVSLVLHVSSMEAAALAGMVGFVWVAEMFNTCIEKIMDCISMEKRDDIKFIKDVASGAVLVASITALIIAAIIFIPKII